MKRYFAFYGDKYYPREGMGDFIGDFDTIEEAVKETERVHKIKRLDDEDNWNYNYAIVWDSKERKDVYK